MEREYQLFDSINTVPLTTPYEDDGCTECGDIDAHWVDVLEGSFTVKQVLMCDDCYEKMAPAEYLAAA